MISVRHLVMSDRISVMEDGRIVQEAAPRDLYISPDNMFVAQFIGQINFLKGSPAIQMNAAWE